MGCLAELNHSRSLLRLVEKLPRQLHNGWAKKVDSITLYDGKPADIDNLLDYVSMSARAAIHSVYGKLFYPILGSPIKTRETRINLVVSLPRQRLRSRLKPVK